MHSWICFLVILFTISVANAQADVGGPIAPTASHPWIAGLALSAAAVLGGFWLTRHSSRAGWLGAYILLWATFILAPGAWSELMLLILALWTLWFLLAATFRLLSWFWNAHVARQQNSAPSQQQATEHEQPAIQQPKAQNLGDLKDSKSQLLSNDALARPAGLAFVYLILGILLCIEVVRPGVLWTPTPRFPAGVNTFTLPPQSGVAESPKAPLNKASE